MKLLKENLKLKKVIFDSKDIEFVNTLVKPFAHAELNEASDRWDEKAGETIHIKNDGNDFVNVGYLNMTDSYITAVTDYLKQKYGDIDVNFNNTASVVWAYTESI